VFLFILRPFIVVGKHDNNYQWRLGDGLEKCCLVDINLAAWSSVHISFSKTFRFESSCVIAVDLNEAVLKILLLACLFVDLTHCENVPEDEEYNETQDNPKDDHPDSTFTI